MSPGSPVWPWPYPDGTGWSRMAIPLKFWLYHAEKPTFWCLNQTYCYSFSAHVCQICCFKVTNEFCKPLNRYIIFTPRFSQDDMLQLVRYGLQSSCVVDYSYAGAGFFGPPGRGEERKRVLISGQGDDVEVFMVDGL